MDVEHLWFSSRPNDMNGAPPHPSFVRRNLVENNTADEHMVQTLANMADKRLYKLVKWCKSLPLFKNILVSISFRLDQNKGDTFHLLVGCPPLHCSKISIYISDR